LKTAISFAASSGFGRTSVTSARSTARYAPSPIPVTAMPTRKTGNESANAMTARPTAYRPAATVMKIFRRSSLSDSQPPIGLAAKTKT
jgi:hypothetical protein